MLIEPPVINDLFDAVATALSSRQDMAAGAVLLRARAAPFEDEILSALAAIIVQAPFRRMVTPGGFVMSVAMTNCGAAGWVTDRTGYRYDRNDPDSGLPWPSMPDIFLALASASADEVGYSGFVPTESAHMCP